MQSPPGSTIRTAVTFPEVQSPNQGVRAEYAYIAEKFPGWTPGRQRLFEFEGRHYDCIDLTGPNGGQRTVHFDITDWFRK